MFSNSNSFLGGGPSGRPGQQQYGQSFQGTPSPFGQQPAGGLGGPLQPQMTGFPGQQGGLYPQQPQPTGFQQQQTGFPGQMQPQPTGFPAQQAQFSSPPPQQSFQTGFQPPQQQQQQAPPAQPQRPQPTGMTSAQMANSFRSSPAAPSQPSPSAKVNSKIPSIRLSFITAQDQAKFEQLFKSAVGNEQALSGDQARDLLMRSKLPGDTLSQIWTLSDTTKSGQLLFPEFALAMYLCNLKLVGKDLPPSLPERIKNEVSSMVDIISFGVPDDALQPPPRTSAPDFSSPSQPSLQAPQPQQPSNSQLLSQLTAQPTGFPGQAGGFGQPSIQIQPTGMMPQQTGFPSNPQATGYNGPRPPMPPMPTGFGSGMGLSPNPTGMMAPLNAQPTGRPGQWGLVNAPASGLPNIDALRERMMPQTGREGGAFTTAGLRGNATVPWAVTKDEKRIYDDLFKAWDGFNKGFISGGQAIEVFGQSGLEKADLERIWTLADPNNRGRLNMDEFAVAMHLIYRKLNGYPVPAQLPPELIPPSTRNLNDSIGTVKSMLSRDAEERKSSGAFLQPQRTGVSYLKTHSFRNTGSPTGFGRKDATVYKNNDDDVGYKSSARHRLGAGGRSPSPAQPASPASERSEDLSLDQLRKMIREKQILLDAMDFTDESRADEDELLDRKDRHEAEDLYRRIRRIQEDIDSHPNAVSTSGDSGAERRALKRELIRLSDKLPALASDVRKTERAIADAQLELFRLRDAKAHGGAAAHIIGTGPGGAVTESDRLKARARAMMQQRSAALTGKPAPSGGDDAEAANRRFEEENARVRTERENNERMIRDVEDSVKDYGKSIEDSLQDGGDDASSEHERRRWEDGLGVEDEVRDFIFDLQRSSRAARVRREDTAREPRPSARSEKPSRTETPRYESPSTPVEPPARPAASTPTGGSYSSYKTPEERAAFIKQQAEARMAERLAALGLKGPSKPGESAQQRAEREQKEREDRIRKAEEEDAKREQERQRRLQDESIAPPTPSGSKAKPPPPPSRKGKADVPPPVEQEIRKTEHDLLKEQQEAGAAERRRLEEAERKQEEELAKEREAALARTRALEEQVRQGKLKKEEEKRRKQAVQKEAKEKESRLAAQRAELEAARERERQLQLQLESLGDEESSDDEGPQEITPQETTPTASQELPRDMGSPPPAPPMPTMAPPVPHTSPPVSSPPSVTSPPDTETKNPFLRKMQQNSAAAAEAPAATPPLPPHNEASTNPFHRLTQAQAVEPPARTRAKPEEDDWSVVESEDTSSDDEEPERPGAGNARQLASILFGTMGPPRPLSSMDNKSNADTPTSPAGGTSSPAPPAPPPPPPMPGMGAPSAPGGPPPPPPMPMPKAGGAGGGGAPDNRGALLSQIQAGKGLRKVQTKEKDSAVVGKVL